MPGGTVRVALAGLVAVLVAGCGGGSSVEEFHEEANGICQEHRAVIEEAASEMMGGGVLPDPQVFGRFAMETVIPELSAQFEELSDVEAPEEVDEAFQEYLSQGQQAVQRLQEDPTFLTDAANFAQVNQAADQAGLSEACHLGPGE